MAIGHPKNGSKCVFCKYWNGNANIVIKSRTMGIEFQNGVLGKCIKNNANKFSTDGLGCRDYEISYEASKVM